MPIGSLKGAGLSAAQIRRWEEIYRAVQREDSKLSDASVAKIAWAQFKLEYKKVGNRWVRKKK